jgi:hypothetical protein
MSTEVFQEKSNFRGEGTRMGQRRIELVCGVLGGLLGLAALAVSLFAPLGTECTDTCQSVSLVEMQGLGSFWIVIALFGVLSLAVVIFSLWHSLSSKPILLSSLWVAAALLCALTIIVILLDFGILFIPADALALTAAILGSRAGMQPALAQAREV